MSQSLRNRLRRLEKSLPEDYPEIIQLIKQGAFYDEISDDMKDLYCLYRGFDREAMESVRMIIAETEGFDTETVLHFQLERNPKPMTPEEEREHTARIAAEVEKLVLDAEERLRGEEL